MTLVKIAEPFRMCRDPQHNPPNMIVLSPGTWQHTCPSCGQTTVLSVPLVES